LKKLEEPKFVPLQINLRISFNVSCGALVEGTLKNGTSNVTSIKYLKLMHYYVALPSFQLWLFPKLPIVFIAFIIKDNFKIYPNDIHFLLSNGKSSSEPNIAISFTKGVQTVSQKITKHHLILLLIILN